MRRRDFITRLCGSAVAIVGGAAVVWPLAARAQQTDKVYRIGYLGQFASQHENEVFQEALRNLDYVEGRNLHIEFRFMEGDEDRLPGLAAELKSV